MNLSKKITSLFAVFFSILITVNAQIQDVGISPDVTTDQPTWIENPIGSIIGLIFLAIIIGGTARVALKRD